MYFILLFYLLKKPQAYCIQGWSVCNELDKGAASSTLVTSYRKGKFISGVCATGGIIINPILVS